MTCSLKRDAEGSAVRVAVTEIPIALVPFRLRWAGDAVGKRGSCFASFLVLPRWSAREGGLEVRGMTHREKYVLANGSRWNKEKKENGARVVNFFEVLEASCSGICREVVGGASLLLKPCFIPGDAEA